jgi:hypothetical protein
VGYASHHLPVVANGLGRLVPTGHAEALADALASTVEVLEPALAAPDKALLPLDRGPTTVRTFDEPASRHVRAFSFDRLSRSVADGIRDLIPHA